MSGEIVCEIYIGKNINLADLQKEESSEDQPINLTKRSINKYSRFRDRREMIKKINLSCVQNCLIQTSNETSTF